MKRLWFLFKSKYQPKCIELCFSNSSTKDEVISTLLRVFNIDVSLNIRLRNSNGNIVAINIHTLQTNTNQTPYIIETWQSEWQLCRSCKQANNSKECDRIEWANIWYNKLHELESRVCGLELLLLHNSNNVIRDDEEVCSRLAGLHREVVGLSIKIGED